MNMVSQLNDCVSNAKALQFRHFETIFSWAGEGASTDRSLARMPQEIFNVHDLNHLALVTIQRRVLIDSQ